MCPLPHLRLRETDAPVLFVSDWSELPALVARVLDEGDDALDERRERLVRWWAAAKSDVGARIAEFARSYRTTNGATAAAAAADDGGDDDRFPTNECRVIELSQNETAAYKSAYISFYGDAHWCGRTERETWKHVAPRATTSRDRRAHASIHPSRVRRSAAALAHSRCVSSLVRWRRGW